MMETPQTTARCGVGLDYCHYIGLEAQLTVRSDKSQRLIGPLPLLRNNPNKDEGAKYYSSVRNCPVHIMPIRVCADASEQ